MVKGVVPNVRDNQLMDRLQSQSSMTASFWSNENAAFICLPGTRVTLRKELIAWSYSDNPDTKSIFWVSGMAGMGKSTIARTVAGHFIDLGHLVASFFFSRDHEAERRDAAKLFTSIAWQLAEASPILKRWICDAISKNGSILWEDLARQWDQLIKQPFQELGRQKNFAERVQRPTVVLVVDALDECTDKQGIIGFLSVLKRLKDIDVVRFRVLITSREEPVILDGMKRLGENVQKCNLAAISQTETDKDLHVYYEHELGLIKRAYLERREAEESENQGRIQDPYAWPKLDSWPEEADVAQLVKMTNGLFQYAKTACGIIGEEEDTPDSRLKLVLETSLDSLDDIYAKDLELAAPSSTKAARTNFSQRFRQIVGVIVLSFDSLSSRSIKCLLEGEYTHDKFNHKVVSDTLNRLRSVLYVPEGADSVVTVIHTSFRDFLIDPTRCTNAEFQIKEEEGHERLFHGCIAVMERDLRKDICNLESPGARIVKRREKADGSEVVDTSDIFECIAERIAPHVQYACRFWVDHLLQVKNESKLFELALRFLRGHLLHWLEALGLIGKISEGIAAITFLESNSKVSSPQ